MMTVPMDNSSAPSARELAEHLYKKVFFMCCLICVDAFVGFMIKGLLLYAFRSGPPPPRTSVRFRHDTLLIYWENLSTLLWIH